MARSHNKNSFARAAQRASSLLSVLLVGVAAFLAAAPANAQSLIDDVGLIRTETEVTARIFFNANVHFVRQTPTTEADLVLIDFQIITLDDPIIASSVSESRSLRAGGGIPDFSVSYQPNAADRRQAQRQLQVRFSRKTLVEVRPGNTARSIDIVFRGAAVAGKPAPAAAAIAPETEKRFAVRLQALPLTEKDKLLPIPGGFDDYEGFSSTTIENGTTYIETALGYFSTREQAEAVLRRAKARFPDAQVIDLIERKELALKGAAATEKKAPTAPAPSAAAAAAASAASAAAAAAAAAGAATTAPAPEAKPQEPSAQPSATAPVANAPEGEVALGEIDKRADDLMTAARTALQDKNYTAAINNLNQVLFLPPNKFSRDAQELIGVAWERAGDLKKARTEYDLYLRLFPQAEGSDRVRQRLAAITEISTPPVPGVVASVPAATSGPDLGNKASGSIAQYFYGGKSRSQSIVNVAAGIDQSTLTKTTESAIVTSLDLSDRYRTESSETHAVLRGTNSKNFLASSHSESVLSAAYVDYHNLRSDLDLRVGRQTAVGGGLLGLFDGLSGGYPLTPKLKLSVMGGVPANQLVSAPSQRLAAAVLDGSGLYEHFGASVYAVEQWTESIVDRKAIGTELRVFGERASIYSLIDYDTQFAQVNAVTLQGSVQAPGQTTLTFLADQRRAPSLQMSNALISNTSGITSLRTLLQTESLGQIKDEALATSAKAKQGLVSVSRSLGQKWQAGFDVRYSSIGALPAIGNFEAQPATGAQYTYTLQLTGSDLYSTRDINGFSLSQLTSSTLHGTQFAYNNLSSWQAYRLTFEPSIRYYTQHDSTGIRLRRYSPGFRVSWQASKRASLLGETLLEHSTTNGPVNSDKTNSAFFYVGYRYDLF